YGVATMEFMALGKPTIVYVRPDLLTGDYSALPIQNANPETVKASVRELITDFDRRLDLAARSRGFVEKVHDAKAIAQTLKSIYEDVYQNPVKQPSRPVDIDYFVARHNDAREERRQAVKEAE